jgi:hypothetical protein
MNGKVGVIMPSELRGVHGIVYYKHQKRNYP